MMLKVNGEFLDFNSIVEVEKRVKLFEEIDETLGDFSYAFELEKTATNMRILGTPLPDVKNKTIYREVNCDLMDESGIVIHKGFLKVERINKKIVCAFYSGNYNWIKLLSGALTDIDFSDLDTDLTDIEIANTWDNTEGIIFPLIDSGGLITRSYKSIMVDDFSGCIFMKTLLVRVFNSAGIKVQGDLMNDPDFCSMLLSRNTKDQSDIDSRTSNVRKTIAQLFPDPTNAVVLFQDETSYPFFDGSKGNFSSSRYTADVKMKVRLDFTIIYFDDSLVPGGKEFGIYINGVFRRLKDFEPTIAAANPTYPILTMTASVVITLEAGDYVEGGAEYNPAGSTATLIIYPDSTFTVTPVFIYLTTGKSLVPNWSKSKLVSNVLNLFCCVCDFEPNTKTLTIDFFDNIKNKEPIDLSNNLTVYEIDYEEFISSFGKRSLLKYQESDTDQIKQYNIEQYVKYGDGEILVDNDFIEDVADILDSGFKAPISYINSALSVSLDRMGFVTLEPNGESEFTSVADVAGMARFNVPDDTIFSVGELVEISESTNSSYLGQYVISSTGSGTGFIIVIGVTFNTSATGKIVKLIHTSGDDDGVYVLINTKYRIDNVSHYSRSNNYYIGSDLYPNVAYAFFNLLNTGLPINNDYTQGLSFGVIENQLSYQKTIIDKSWGTVARVLNDPVKLRCDGYIPQSVFKKITPLRPIRLKTLESNNLYYLNSISGYVNSSMTCDVELIKLT